jgi:hypothetical protein
MTLALRASPLLFVLFPIVAYAQPPDPDKAVAVTSVTFAPDTVSYVTVHVHNKGGKDITHLSGTLNYTPYGIAAAPIRCSTSTLERYVYATSPKLKGVTTTTDGKAPAVKGTLNAGEDLDFTCPVKPTKIEKAEFVPDTVIYSDQTWRGDQDTAENEFRQRKRVAGDYGKLLIAVADAEKAPDPAARYKEILDEWEAQVGITQTPTATIHRQTKVSDFPYYRLSNYYRQYLFAQKVKETETAAGRPTGTVQQIAHPYIELLKRRDIALGAAYHIHAQEAK